MNDDDSLTSSTASPSGITDKITAETNHITYTSSSNIVPPFPVTGILPKEEIQADSFIASRPESDGRGVVVAIFDTGTDIAAPGLLITTEGKIKVLDAVDCSGSGDVSTSTIVHTNDDENTITGLSGRVLHLPSSFINPTRTWHLGIKRVYELFPDILVSRLKKERRKKFDEHQRQCESALYSLINNHTDNVEHTNTQNNKADRELLFSEIKSLGKSFEDAGPIYDILVWHDGTHWTAVVDTSENGQLAQCQPLHDYHLFHEYSTFSGVDLMHYTVNIYDEGSVCQIVVQAGAHGTHVAGIVAAHFPGQPEMNGIAPGAQLLSVKIGDSRLGSMETGTGLIRGLLYALKHKVDLINMSYGEATSVPDQGRFCELVSELVNKYGVIFVSSAGNAGPALTTAGAPGATTTEVIGVGAFVSPSMMLAEYSLRKSLEATQYTWSSRAPAADGGVGVCISACGGAITSVPTWTLQGVQLMNGTSMSSPAACGGIALLISALKHHHLPYSPHRIRKAIENTAKRIPNLDHLTQGCGLLQVESAYDYLTKYSNYDDLDILYHISVTGGGRGVYLREWNEVNKDSEVSITVEPSFYEQEQDDEWHEEHENNNTDSVVASASSIKKGTAEEHKDNNEHDKNSENESNNASNEHSEQRSMNDTQAPSSSHLRSFSASGLPYRRNQKKVDYQLRVALINTAPSYVDVPSHLLLMHGGRSFSITVHPQQLQPGVHFSEIHAIDSQNPERGILFRIPITILIPEHIQQLASGHQLIDNTHITSASPSAAATTSTPGTDPCMFPLLAPGIEYTFPSLSFTPGHVVRKFLVVPFGTTVAEFVLRGHEIDTVRSFMLHCVFLLPDTPYRDWEMNKHLSLNNEEEVRYSMDVVGGRTLEVCLAQYWNVWGNCLCDLSVQFHGAAIAHGDLSSPLCWDGNAPIHRVDVCAPLRQEHIHPTAQLKYVHQPLRPTSAVLSALSATRDTLPHARQCYQMIFTYQYECKEDNMKIIPRFPLIQDVLYEAVYESRFFMVFDSHKRLYGSGDAWPKEISIKKGKFIVRLQVRHDDHAMLDKLKDMVCIIESHLSKPIDLNAYPSFTAALVVSGNKFGDRRVLKRGQRKPVFFTIPEMKQLPTYVRGGDWLLGTLHILKQTNPNGGDRKGGYDLKISIPPLILPASTATNPGSSPGTGHDKKKPVDVVKKVKDVDREKVDKDKDKEKEQPKEEDNKVEKDQEKEEETEPETTIIKESDPDHDNEPEEEKTKEEQKEKEKEKDKEVQIVAVEVEEKQKEKEETEQEQEKKEESIKPTDTTEISTAVSPPTISPVLKIDTIGNAAAATITAKTAVTPHTMHTLAVAIAEYAGQPASETASTDTTNAMQDKGDTKNVDDEVEQISADIRDLQIDYMMELTGKKKQLAYQQLSPSLVKSYPDHLPLLILLVEVLYDAYKTSLSSKTSSVTSVTLSSLCAACDHVITVLDPVAISAHFGRIMLKDDRHAQQIRKEMESNKDRLVHILNIKLNSIRDTISNTNATSSASAPGATIGAITTPANSDKESLVSLFDSVYNELSTWIDLTSKDSRRKYSSLISFHDQLHQQWGTAIKALNALITEASVGDVTKDVYEQRIELLEAMNQQISNAANSFLFQHLIDSEMNWNIVRFPKDFTPF